MIQIEQIPIDQRIGQAVFASMPAHWQGAALTAERKTEGTNESYRIEISARPAAPGIALASEALELAIRELFLLHRRHKTGMRVAQYFIERAGGQPQLVAEFKYDD
ncbi:MAG TPA: hypothetical protein VGI39_23825 [Polyangiaceae bacterium]|jgi:hypothetical protein